MLPARSRSVAWALHRWSRAAAPHAEPMSAPPNPPLPALQLAIGDLVPVVPAAAGGAAELQRPVLARVTAIERLVDVGVFMPHTLTGACVYACMPDCSMVAPAAAACRQFARGAPLRIDCMLLLPPCCPHFPASPQAPSLLMAWLPAS